MHVSKQTGYSPLQVCTYQPQVRGAQVHQHIHKMCCRPAAFSAKPVCSHALAYCSEHMGHKVLPAHPAAHNRVCYLSWGRHSIRERCVSDHKWKQEHIPSAIMNKTLSRDTIPTKSLRLFGFPKQCAEAPNAPALASHQDQA